MTIEIDDASFYQIVSATVGRATTLETYETRALIAVAQLAVWIDLEEDAEEHALLAAIVKHICAYGGIDPDSIEPLSPVPIDEEERMARIAALADDLERVGVRELAYVLAYLLAVSDLQLGVLESKLLDELQRALAVPPERANELVDRVGRIVTPEPPIETNEGAGVDR